MFSTRNSILSFFGFESNQPESARHFRTAMALAGAMAALPLLLLLPVDTDRAIPLIFFPAIFFAWKLNLSASRGETWLLIFALCALTVAALLSPHTARAMVMTAAVGWTIAGAIVAKKIASSRPAIRLVLAGIAIGAVLGVLMVRWGIAADRMFFPVYWSARLFGAHEFVGCIAILVLLVNPPENPRLKPIIILAALIIWTGFAWSGSRAPAVGLAVFLSLWFWRGSAHDRRMLLRWVPLLSVAGLLFSYFLGIPYLQLGWWDAFNRTVTASGIADVSSDRSNFWSVVWTHIQLSPWIGQGADAYLFIHPHQNGNQPHNMVLQWLLEYGVIGTIPLALLLLRGLRGFFKIDPPTSNPDTYPIWTAASVAGAMAYGFLDGVFYHMIIFMPVAVLIGFAWGCQNRIVETHVSAKSSWATFLVAGALGLSGLTLGVHNWLNSKLLSGRAEQPDSLPAKVLRFFPSATYGLQNWTDAWLKTQPDLAWEWIRWAQTVSTNQNAFHAYAAQLYLNEKNFTAAEQELWLCLKKGPDVEHQDILDLIARVQASAAAQLAAKSAADQATRPDSGQQPAHRP